LIHDDYFISEDYMKNCGRIEYGYLEILSGDRSNLVWTCGGSGGAHKLFEELYDSIRP